MKSNKMSEIEIEKMIINCSGVEEKFEKSVKLLEMITKGNRKVYKVSSRKRVPAFNISPGKNSGAKITIRNKEEINDLLDRFFVAIDNKISRKQITDNQFSFGIEEYIEVPGLEYNRGIGMLGFEVTIVFKRKGKRVKIRKRKKGKYPKKQIVKKKDIIEYLNKNYEVEIE